MRLPPQASKLDGKEEERCLSFFPFACDLSGSRDFLLVALSTVLFSSNLDGWSSQDWQTLSLQELSLKSPHGADISGLGMQCLHLQTLPAPTLLEPVPSLWKGLTVPGGPEEPATRAGPGWAWE